MLPPHADFARMIDQLVRHDDSAIAELIHHYERDVCRQVEADLRRCSLGRLVDAADIWQAVLLRFYRRASEGRLELTEPEQLLHLLRTMARNELRDQARWARRACRDIQRERIHDDRKLRALADDRPGPAAAAETHDLLERALRQLHHNERELVLGWADGRTWQELTAGPADTAEAARKRFDRVIARLARLLSPTAAPPRPRREPLSIAAGRAEWAGSCQSALPA